MLNEPELIDFVIKEMGQHISHNDIVRDVCLKGNMTWKQAEEFVKDVEIDYRQDIAKRQSPLLYILSAGVLIGGLLLTAGPFIIFMIEYQQYGEVSDDAIEALGALQIGIPMIISGLIGFWQTSKSLKKR